MLHMHQMSDHGDRTILSTAEQCAEAQKISTEEAAQSEITQMITSKLFILKGIMKSELAERRKIKKVVTQWNLFFLIASSYRKTRNAF